MHAKENPEESRNIRPIVFSPYNFPSIVLTILGGVGKSSSKFFQVEGSILREAPSYFILFIAYPYLVSLEILPKKHEGLQ